MADATTPLGMATLDDIANNLCERVQVEAYILGAVLVDEKSGRAALYLDMSPLDEASSEPSARLEELLMELQDLLAERELKLALDDFDREANDGEEETKRPKD